MRASQGHLVGREEEQQDSAGNGPSFGFLHRSLARSLKVGELCKHGNTATYSFSIESLTLRLNTQIEQILLSYKQINRYTQDRMVLTKQVILTDKAPQPLSVLNQGLVVGDMVYCSGQVGTDPATGKLVEGTVADRAVSLRTKSLQRTASNI